MSQAIVFHLIKPLFGYEYHISLAKKICQWYLSGQIIATLHDLTPRGSRGRESPLISGKSRLVNYYNLARFMEGWKEWDDWVFSDQSGALWGLRNPKISKQQKSWVQKTLGWRWLLPTWKERNFVSQWGFQRGQPSMVHIEKFWSMLPQNHANMLWCFVYCC